VWTSKIALRASLVGDRHVDVAVESTGTEQGAVDQVRPVGRGDHDDVLEFLEAVQFRQELRDDAFADAGVALSLAAFASDRVDLVEEDHGRCVRPRLLEDLANALSRTPRRTCSAVRGL